jgi:hypothetical protein
VLTGIGKTSLVTAAASSIWLPLTACSFSMARPIRVTCRDGHRHAHAHSAAVLVGFSTFGVSPLQRTELADRAHACRCARRADGPRLFGPAGVIHPPAGRGDLL